MPIPNDLLKKNVKKKKNSNNSRYKKPKIPPKKGGRMGKTEGRDLNPKAKKRAG